MVLDSQVLVLARKSLLSVLVAVLQFGMRTLDINQP